MHNPSKAVALISDEAQQVHIALQNSAVEGDTTLGLSKQQQRNSSLWLMQAVNLPKVLR